MQSVSLNDKGYQVERQRGKQQEKEQRVASLWSAIQNGMEGILRAIRGDVTLYKHRENDLSLTPVKYWPPSVLGLKNSAESIEAYFSPPERRNLLDYFYIPGREYTTGSVYFHIIRAKRNSLENSEQEKKAHRMLYISGSENIHENTVAVSYYLDAMVTLLPEKYVEVFIISPENLGKENEGRYITQVDAKTVGVTLISLCRDWRIDQVVAGLEGNFFVAHALNSVKDLGGLPKHICLDNHFLSKKSIDPRFKAYEEEDYFSFSSRGALISFWEKYSQNPHIPSISILNIGQKEDLLLNNYERKNRDGGISTFYPEGNEARPKQEAKIAEDIVRLAFYSHTFYVPPVPRTPTSPYVRKSSVTIDNTLGRAPMIKGKEKQE